MLDELIKSDKSAKLKQKTRLINKRAGLILKYIAELATTLAVSIFNSILD